MPYEWFDSLPQDTPLTRQYHKVRGIKGMEIRKAVLLGNKLAVAPAHYEPDRGRTFPCTGNECVLCFSGIRKSVKAYIAAMDYHTNEEYVLELTEASARQLVEIADQAGKMRGMRVALTRKHKGKNAKVVVTWHDFDHQGYLPEAFPVQPELERLWGYQEKKAARPPLGNPSAN